MRANRIFFLLLSFALPSISAQAQSLSFSHDRGFYNTAFQLNVTTDLPGATIRYTTDYNLPTTTTGQIYSTPISISQTTTIRVLAYNTTDTLRSVTQTYLFLQDIIAHDTMQTHITQDPTWGPQLEMSFKSIPSAIVTSGDLINGTTRVAGSIEFLFPDSTKNLQANCGLKEFGNGGSHTDRMSQRLYFDSEWDGPKNLKHPMFEDFEEGIPAVEKFDKLDLRHGWYGTYANKLHDTRYPDYKRHNYISTKMGDDMMLKMGNLSPHTRFMHVYNNGIYNGIVTVRERFDDNMVAEYLGGESSDYEYLATPNQRVSVFHPFAPELQSGTGVHWADAVTRSQTSFSSFKDIVEIDNFFDRMIAFSYAHAEAEYRAVAAPQLGKKFLFNINDSDYFFHSGNVFHSNRSNPLHNMNGPENMFRNLYELNDPDFFMEFADRVHLHLTNNGFLTPNNVYNHWQYIAGIVEDAMIAEAARWSGDLQENPNTWRTAMDTVKQIFTDHRTQVLLDDYKETRLYPTLDAVQYSHPEGLVNLNTNLVLTNPNPNGTIYYTLNGDDPRSPGGAISPSAQPFNTTLLLNQEVNKVKARVLGTDTTYNATNHAIGKPSSMSTTLYTNKNLPIKANDGDIFGVLNGDFVTRPKSQYQPWWEVNLQSQKDIHKIKVWYSSDLGSYFNNKNIHVFVSPTPFPNLDAAGIKADPNVTSFYIDGQGGDLIEFELPANYSGQYVRVMMNHSTQTLWLAEVEVLEYDYANPVVNQVWSAMKPQLFHTPQPYSNLIINEVHYNPEDSVRPDSSVIGGRNFEFVELKNIGNQPVTLYGDIFLKGISINLDTIIVVQPNAFAVFGEDAFWFEAKYGMAPTGQYTGKLSNDGENLVFQDPFANGIDSISFDGKNPWDEMPDSSSHTLELLHPSLDNSDPLNWFRSDNPWGTPFAENSRICSSTTDQVVINEINYNSDNNFFDPGDWVELHNPTSSPVNISGYSFYDNGNEFVIPSGTVIPAFGFFILAEDKTAFTTLFNSLPAGSVIGDFGFGLSSGGERISLFNASKCLVDHVIYDNDLPWPLDPANGTGATLSLIDPALDNALAPSWETSANISAPYGTPGYPNQDYAVVNLKVLLEGPFNNFTGQMNTTLNTVQGLLPGQTPASAAFTPTPAGQPYTSAPWSYGGSEGNGWNDGNYSTDVVDWILVSFRTGIQKSTELYKAAALVYKDGTVVFPDGPFVLASSPDLYIVVQHRNHLTTMSANPVQGVNGVYTFDFTQADGYTGAGGFGQKLLPNGSQWALYAGDVDQVQVPYSDIQGGDKAKWSLVNGNFGSYSVEDVNMDGDIDGADKSVWSNNNGISSQVEK